MKNSFLYQKYRKIAFALSLFVLGLVIFFSISITFSSRRYLDRFVAHNTQMTQSYLKIFQEDAAIRVSRWSLCESTRNAFISGDQGLLEQLFSQRVKTIGLTDVRILLREAGKPSYIYEGRPIPDELLLFENETGISKGSFSWVGDDFWYYVSQETDGYLVMMAVPIDHENLTELAVYLEGNLLKDIEITHEDQYLSRDLLHWQRLIFSVPIDQENQAYLTYTFDMNSLAEYFYWSYGVTILVILLFFVWIMRFRLKRMILEAHGQIRRFEKEINLIASGDYGRKVQESNYHEFNRLGKAVNFLTDAIEERNLALSDHVQELYGLLIQVLEQKDPYTRGHSERVARYAKGIAGVLGLENADEIHAAGLLHDVGKIAIPESVLNKPGRYTEGEYEYVKEHAQRGYDLLLESKEFHRIRTWVLYHHERMDGSGYPKGLKGKEIPFESRIIAVADVFDAMTSDRSYRPALSEEEALAYLCEQEGKGFEKSIVDALKEYFKASSEG